LERGLEAKPPNFFCRLTVIGGLNIIIIYLPRVCKSNNNNSEQTVGQDSKAPQDALITAHKNYAYAKETQH